MKTQLRYIIVAIFLITGGLAIGQGKYGTDSVQCTQNISMYQEAMKQNNIEDAYKPWRKILEICPAWSKGAYQNGAKIMTTLIAKEEDAERKQRLIDSLYMVHDMRIEHFGEEAYVLGRKGLDMLIYEPSKCKEAYEILKRAVELGGSSSEAGTLSAYYQALNCMVVKGEADKEQLISDYVIVNEHLENSLADPNLRESDLPYYMQARENVNSLFLKVAECGDITRIVKESVKNSPDDDELKARMLKVLNAKDCTEDPIYRTLAEEVHRANPTSESAYSLAMMLVRDKDMTGALRFMKEALDLCNDCLDRNKYLLKAGQIAGAAGSHSQSRTYANQLLQIEPGNSDALMLIGNAVYAQAGTCSEPDVWGVYWLAYDYYQRAQASERMAATQGRFPTSGEAFFHQLSEGQTVQVTCGGLNESTKVRTRKE